MQMIKTHHVILSRRRTIGYIGLLACVLLSCHTQPKQAMLTQQEKDSALSCHSNIPQRISAVKKDTTLNTEVVAKTTDH